MKRTTLLMIIIVGIAFLQVPFSCTTNQRQPEYEYYYYPSKNVYFNPLTKNYFFSLDGGKTWDSTYHDLGITATLGERKVIRSTEAEVWRKNEQHRKDYNGILYNLNREDSSLNVVANGVSEKKDYQKGGVIKKRTPKQDRSKFRKFLDKVFGKKKKKEE